MQFKRLQSLLEWVKHKDRKDEKAAEPEAKKLFNGSRLKT